MPQFMLLLYETPGGYAKVSPAEIQAIIEKYSAWTGKLAAAGKLMAGHKLKEEGGKALTQSSDRLSVVDGPYSETKEVVGGYFILRAATYDEAVGLASDCPHLAYGRIDVREVDFMGHPET